MARPADTECGNMHNGSPWNEADVQAVPGFLGLHTWNPSGCKVWKAGVKQGALPSVLKTGQRTNDVLCGPCLVHDLSYSTSALLS